MKNNVKFITRTAVLIALLVVVQFVTKPLGQLVTGSCVNFVLIAATLLSGSWSAVLVALVSPFLASLFGIGPVIHALIPLVALGNLVLVLIYTLIVSKKTTLFAWVAGIVVGAVVKYLVLYLTIVRLALPLLNLPEAQVKAMSAAFGITQLITALIGGVIAMIAVPLVQKALRAK